MLLPTGRKLPPYEFPKGWLDRVSPEFRARVKEKIAIQERNLEALNRLSMNYGKNRDQE